MRLPQSQELCTFIFLPYVVGPIVKDACFDTAIDGLEHRRAWIDSNLETAWGNSGKGRSQ